jgi:hypothetical protein
MAIPPGKRDTPRQEMEDKLLTKLTVIEDLATYSPNLEEDIQGEIVSATYQIRHRVLSSDEDDADTEAPPDWENDLEIELNLGSIERPELDNDAGRRISGILNNYLIG